MPLSGITPISDDAQPNAGNPGFAHRASRFLFFLLFLFFFFFAFFAADRTRLT
jgi:hypothetical protein